MPSPLVSVFTPSHDPRHLAAAYISLAAQTYREWEWVVLLNGGAAWSPPVGDPRVRVVSVGDVAGVGEAKRLAVEQTSGDLLVELDHDDLLASRALELVVAAHTEDPDAALYYSHWATVDEAGQPIPAGYAPEDGWQYRAVEVDGLALAHPVAMAPTPHNVALIQLAPNHLRAFTRAKYLEAGGYDPARVVADDAALMCELYKLGAFHLIDEVLYLQRMHGGNTQLDPVLNPAIQHATLELYDEHLEAMAAAWADREGLLALDLGACHQPAPGYVPVDQHLDLEAIAAEVEGATLAAAYMDTPHAVVDTHGNPLAIRHTFPEPMPLAEGSVGVIRAYDFLEHVADKLAIIREVYRLLAPGGLLLTRTPSTDGRGAWQDPTHVAGYNEHSWWYYTDPAYASYIAAELGGVRFQTSRLVTYHPSPWHEANLIPYVQANLIALKPDAPRNGGRIAW